MSDGVPNILAYLALLAWPAVSLAMFFLFKPALACTLALLGADMFLPAVVSFDAPLIPPLDKDSIPSVAALMGCLLRAPGLLARARPGRGYDRLVLLAVVGAFFTARLNANPLVYGPTVLPGHSMYDFVSDAVKLVLQWWIPFFLGRALFRSEKDLQTLLTVLAIAAVMYSLFIWVEIRMSPQFNRWIYGYHQSDFIQTIRGGGYRPKVFMRHGLNVAFFIVVGLLAAATLTRAKKPILGLPAMLWAAYLGIVLLVCKSAGALVYATGLVPLVLFVKPQHQCKVIGVGAIALVTYPLLRLAGWIPVTDIVAFFGGFFGRERAQSLWFRLHTEKELLARATERFWFGWGGYARNFIYDPMTGRSFTVVDGFWVITFGTRGMVGFVGIFGLLLLPLWRLRRKMKNLISPADRLYAAAVGVMGMLYVTDLIPNSGISPYLTFLVGALAGLDPRPDEARRPSWAGPHGEGHTDQNWEQKAVRGR